jgi:hypothetical protein
MASKTWYVAVLVVASQVGAEPAGEPLIDLQYRLIQASSDEEAYAEAMGLGRQEEHSYPNAEGQTVAWRFVGLHDLRSLDAADLTHGLEVFSAIIRADAGGFVTPKAKLTCFWAEANKHRRVQDLLNDPE